MKKLKMKLANPILILVIPQWLMALLILSLTLPTLLAFYREPIPLEEVDFTDDIEGLYVTGTIYSIYDSYCITTTLDGELTSRQYIIDAGDYYYMGIYIQEDGISRADALMNATQAYLSGTSDGILLSDMKCTVTGIIRKMSSADLEYYHEALNWETLGSQTKQLYLPYYLETLNPAEDTIINYSGALLAAVVFLFLGFLLLALDYFMAAQFGRYRKEAKKYIRASSNPAATMQELRTFVQNTPAIHELRYNDRYICDIYGGYSVFGETTAIVWIYKYFPNPQSSSLIFLYADGTKQVAEVKSEAIADEHIYHLQPLCPQALFGYSKDLDTLYHNDWDAFLNLRYHTFYPVR